MPWYIHSIRDCYSEGCHAQIEGTKCAFAVCEPYYGNLLERLCAAWWIITGRAHAFTWPKAGDIEAALGIPLWDRAAEQRIGKQAGI